MESPDSEMEKNMDKGVLRILLLLVISIFASSAFAAAPQSRVTKEVRHELIMLPHYNLFDWLQFDLKNDGTLVLLGQVSTPVLKKDAERAVKDIEGVERVENQIEVLPVSGQDDRIRRAVYYAIYGNNSPLFRYATAVVPSIHIIVKSGNVWLKGVVANKGDSDIAYIRARGVPGVFSVKNELEVEK